MNLSNNTIYHTHSYYYTGIQYTSLTILKAMEIKRIILPILRKMREPLEALLRPQQQQSKKWRLDDKRG
jgi:hypothetical protein